MKSPLFTRDIRRLCLTLAALFLTAPAEAHRCDFLFESLQSVRERAIHETAPSLLNSSWYSTADRDYQAMLIELGAVARPGEPLPEHTAGTMIYRYWQRHPLVENPYPKLGFAAVEERGPARFDFPASFSDIVSKIQSQSLAGNFKLATYNTAGWFRLDQPMPTGAVTEVATDLPFATYATIVAEGYTPLWPGRSSLGLLHDLAHVTEYLEHPEVFPALQKFFKHYLRETKAAKLKESQKVPYIQRAKFFNEISYILKPSKYSAIDSLMVTTGGQLGSLPMHVIRLRRSLKQDPHGTLERVRNLTDAFDELFDRHGGGARDVFAIDTRLSQDIIEEYVNVTKANPMESTLNHGFPAIFLTEFAESPEGIKRQIQLVSRKLEAEPSDELQNFLAFRVAQLEVALLTQRKLGLTQVDIIENSMLPIGSDSKTSRYMRAYLPPSAKLNLLYNLPGEAAGAAEVAAEVALPPEIVFPNAGALFSKAAP